ncbi:regulatory protein RecX family protein [Prunus dulcis]|nr:regulatory protein RecX family protein [Prunus dulcis]
MAIHAGILCLKTQFQFPCRVFVMSWAREKIAIKYIPKKSSQVKKSENYQQTKVSEQKKSREFPDAGALKSEVKQCGRGVQKNRGFDEKPQNQNHVSYKNYLFNDVEKELEDQIDHLSGDVGYELMEEPEEVFEELNTHQVKKCYEKDVLHDAEKVAIKLLATRAFTAVELRKKLHGKNFSLDTVEAVINDFISRGLINDSVYAEAFSRSRWSSSSWGPRRIKKALFSKGVSKLDAENAIKLVFEEGESDNDQKLVHGLSKLSMDNLLVQASKQWLRGQEVPKETRKSRIVRWLQYRGFNWDV